MICVQGFCQLSFFFFRLKWHLIDADLHMRSCWPFRHGNAEALERDRDAHALCILVCSAIIWRSGVRGICHKKKWRVGISGPCFFLRHRSLIAMPGPFERHTSESFLPVWVLHTIRCLKIEQTAQWPTDRVRLERSLSSWIGNLRSGSGCTVLHNGTERTELGNLVDNLYPGFMTRNTALSEHSSFLFLLHLEPDGMHKVSQGTGNTRPFMMFVLPTPTTISSAASSVESCPHTAKISVNVSLLRP